MHQRALLEPQRLQLVGDAQGGILYSPGVPTAAQAQDWFLRLRDGIDWGHDQRYLQGRELPVSRLVARLRLDDGSVLPPPLPQAVALLERLTGARYNSIGLNYYRDGEDSVAQHNDRLDELIPNHPVALLSLGATRRMTIRAKAPPNRAQHIDLEPGSLLRMSFLSQLRFLHGIPKTRHEPAARISLVLRLRPGLP